MDLPKMIKQVSNPAIPAKHFSITSKFWLANALHLYAGQSFQITTQNICAVKSSFFYCRLFFSAAAL